MSLMKTQTGKTMTSIIWGLGIAALFFLACREGGLLVVKAPEDFDNGVYKYDSNCYKFSPYPAKCEGTQEGFTPDVDGNCGQYRHQELPSFEFPDDASMMAAMPMLTGYQTPLGSDRVSNCLNTHKFQHPHCLFNESMKAKNCGDPRHYRKPSCYKTDPVNSIFRA